MTAFYRNFLHLCANNRVSPSAVAKSIGLSNAAATGWKNGKMPSSMTVFKIAEYFSVDQNFLLGHESENNDPICVDEEKAIFYYNFVELCNKNKISPSAAAEKMGFQRSVVTRWSKGISPRQATLQKVADYFGVSVEYLTGVETEENTATEDGSGIGLRTTNYDKLSDENKMLIDQMIEKLVRSQFGG